MLSVTLQFIRCDIGYLRTDTALAGAEQCRQSTNLEICNNAESKAAHPSQCEAQLIQLEDLGFFWAQGRHLFVADVHGGHPCQGQAQAVRFLQGNPAVSLLTGEDAEGQRQLLKYRNFFKVQ